MRELEIIREMIMQNSSGIGCSASGSGVLSGKQHEHSGECPAVPGKQFMAPSKCPIAPGGQHGVTGGSPVAPGKQAMEPGAWYRPSEECGVFGVYDANGDVAHTTYYGLYALQHRGQESCGIAVNKDRNIKYHRSTGLVYEAFDNEALDMLKGNMAVGHVRYSGETNRDPENSQPLVLRYIKGTLAIVHNGRIMNGEELKEEFARTGAIFQTDSDTETIAYAIARERINSMSIEYAVQKVMGILRGAYSVILMSPKKLIAFRDRWGFRPLCMGYGKGGSIVFASESCALDAVGAKFERDIDPGEIVVVEQGKVRSLRDNTEKVKSSFCIFEYIYFARIDSVIHGQGVYGARKAAGRALALEHPVSADIVIGVPDSGLGAAMGYSEQSGIPYAEGFVKNRYVGRTFINPENKDRESAVRIKLNPLKSTIDGKKVIMVDDSIVRGTTCARIVKLLREAGAAEVHVRVSSPPFKWQCFFGTDIPTRKELIACSNSTEEMRNLIGADSLAFLNVNSLDKIVGDANCGFCDACFTGAFPIAVDSMSQD